MSSQSPPEPDTHNRRIPLATNITRRKKYARVGIIPLSLKSVLAGIIVGILLIFLFIAVALTAGYAFYQISGRILPGVSVHGIRLGNLTFTEAAIELQKYWNMEHTILVSDGIHSQQVSPSQLGLSVEALMTANNAFDYGRGEGQLKNFYSFLRSLSSTSEIELIVNFDAQSSQSGLAALATEMSKPAKNATIQVDGGILIEIPYEYGYTINIEETITSLAVDPRAIMLRAELGVVLKPVLPGITDIAEVLYEANKLVDSPYDLHIYDPITNEYILTTIPRTDMIHWLAINPGSEGPVVTFDEIKIAEYLTSFSTTLGPNRWIDSSEYSQPLANHVLNGSPLTMVLNYSSTTYVVQPGDTFLKIGWNVGVPFWMIMKANPELDPDSLRVGQELNIPAKTDLLTYPVIPEKRVVISISKQRLWIYQNGELLSKHVISTGIDRSPTQPGVFQVQTHEKNAYASVWDLYMPHFLGIYEAWPGFMNGIHGLPTLSSGRRLWANVLGNPASYGCIIMKLDAAEWLYNWAEQGVVVEIIP